VSIFDVRHQPRAHRLLQRALASERMPHAYLFAGPEGVGREMLACRLAQRLLCASPVDQPAPADLRETLGVERVGEACGTCPDCRLVLADTHPDLTVIHRMLAKQHPDSEVRKKKAQSLSIEVIRHFMIGRVALRPMHGQAKIFIIREAERLSDAAENCLLKTLEEPPQDTFIILISSAMDRMLPTTRSRCQQVLFGSLPVAFIAERLAELRPATNSLEVAYLAQHANGSLGRALECADDGLFALATAWAQRLGKLASQPPGFSATELVEPFLADARQLAKGVAERDPEMSDLDASRAGLQRLLSVLAGWYREAMRQATGLPSDASQAELDGLVREIAAGWDPGAMVRALRQLNDTDLEVGRNANIDLAAAAMFIRLAGVFRRRSARLV